MSTRAQLLSEVSTSFSNNTVGAITPAILRTQQNDLINSTWIPATDGTPGPAAPAFNLMRKVWVSKAGNDTTGSGTLAVPYLTIGKALAVILAQGDNTAATPYVIQVEPGTYTEAVALLPWVWIVGSGDCGGTTGNPALFHTLPLTGSTVLDGILSIDSSWSYSYMRGGFVSIYTTDHCSFSFPVGSDGCVLDLINFSALGMQAFLRGVQSCVNWVGGTCSDPGISNGYSYVRDCSFPISFTLNAGNGDGSPLMYTVVMENCDTASLNLVQTGGGGGFIYCAGCDIAAAAASFGGFGVSASINFDAISWPTSSPPSLSGGATAFIRTTSSLATGLMKNTTGTGVTSIVPLPLSMANGGTGVTTLLGVVPQIKGLDNRSGRTSGDGSAITLFTTVNGTSLFRITADIFATASVTGTAIYTITWTQNGTTQTMVVNSTTLNTLATATDLINPDNATAITARLTGTFTGIFTVAGLVEQIA